MIVEVVASALDRADLLQRRGGYPGPKLVYGGRPLDIPGMELSGNVVELVLESLSSSWTRRSWPS